MKKTVLKMGNNYRSYSHNSNDKKNKKVKKDMIKNTKNNIKKDNKTKDNIRKNNNKKNRINPVLITVSIISLIFFITAIVFAFQKIIILGAFSHDLGNIPLLAVSQDGLESSTADMLLEVRDGFGRIFIDTYPITKLDTQMATRFAKGIACDYLNMDCSNLDFIYTIKANSAIVGGPSAGAATAMLTIGVLSDIDLDNDVAVTGTINSGGIIGPVGGLKAKIRGAASAGLKKVLIPNGQRFINDLIPLENVSNIPLKKIPIKNASLENRTHANASNISKTNILSDIKNNSIDLIEYGKDLNITVKEVATLDDVVFEFTGKHKSSIKKTIEVDATYSSRMKMVSEMLCNRTEKLISDSTSIILNTSEISDNDFELLKSASDKQAKAMGFMNNKNYYSAASLCFGANVIANKAYLQISDANKSKILTNLTYQIKKEFDSIGRYNYSYVSDLETYMIVVERLIEAKGHIKDFILSNSSSDLALAIERYNSAIAWSEFFGMPGKLQQINPSSLKSTCLNMITDAEQRMKYAEIYLPTSLKSASAQLRRAKADYTLSQYELCIFKASKAKAQVNLILDTLSVPKKLLNMTLNERLDTAARVINEQINKNIFPILGYSYYEYASSLKDSDIYSSFLYSEYALELSNLDIYFKEKPSAKTNFFPSSRLIWFTITILLSGVAIGFLIANLKNRC